MNKVVLTFFVSLLTICNAQYRVFFQSWDIKLLSQNSAYGFNTSYLIPNRVKIDFNGDGFDDYYSYVSSQAAGAASFYFGKITASTAPVTPDYSVMGEKSGDLFGRIATSLDFNGDGHMDWATSAVGSTSGRVYIIFGNGANLPSNSIQTLLSNGGAISIDGAQAIAFPVNHGDVNKDGFEDLVFSDIQNTHYVIFGKKSASSFSVSAISGKGFTFVPSSVSNGSVLELLDINGDTFCDVFIGPQLSGYGYVVFGASSFTASTISSTALNGNNGFSIHITTDTQQKINSAATTCDFNGDGIMDLVFGDVNWQFATGRFCVVLGGTTFGNSIDLTQAADGTNTACFQVPDNNFNYYFGSTLDCAKMNGDKYADVMVSSPGQANRGAAYVFYGSATFFSNTIYTNTLTGKNGFAISGPGNPRENFGALYGFDTNHDGYKAYVVTNGTNTWVTYACIDCEPPSGTTSGSGTPPTSPPNSPPNSPPGTVTASASGTTLSGSNSAPAGSGTSASGNSVGGSTANSTPAGSSTVSGSTANGSTSKGSGNTPSATGNSANGSASSTSASGSTANGSGSGASTSAAVTSASGNSNDDVASFASSTSAVFSFIVACIIMLA